MCVQIICLNLDQMTLKPLYIEDSKYVHIYLLLVYAFKIQSIKVTYVCVCMISTIYPLTKVEQEKQCMNN